MKKDILAESLDITPDTDTEVQILREMPVEMSQAEEDFKFARDNVYEVIDKAQEAVNELFDVAKSSQHPRAYEVLNSMLKNVVDMSTALVDLQKKKSEVLGRTPDSSVPQVVHNNLFVGTTSELLKRVEEMRKLK